MGSEVSLNAQNTCCGFFRPMQQRVSFGGQFAAPNCDQPLLNVDYREVRPELEIDEKGNHRHHPDKSQLTPNSKLKNGEYMFAVDKNNNIIYGKKFINGRTYVHSSLIGGRSPQVKTAGNMIVNGRHITFNNASGHFKPPFSTLHNQQGLIGKALPKGVSANFMDINSGGFGQMAGGGAAVGFGPTAGFGGGPMPGFTPMFPAVGVI